MAFFDKAKDALEITKLNVKISEHNKKIGDIKEQLGELCWQRYCDGGETPADMAELCGQIAARLDEIKGLEGEIAALKDEQNKPAAPAAAPAGNVCAACGAANDAGAKFCKECGSRIEAPAKKFCPSCGQEVAPGVRFCGSCGAKIEG